MSITQNKKILCIILASIFSSIFGGLSGIYYSQKKIQIRNQIFHWKKSIISNWNNDFDLVQIPSSKDGNLQVAYFSASVIPDKPLLVSLHSWSSDYSEIDPLANMAQKHDWNYIHPDFRGPNNSKEACLSKLALSDIDDAIQYAIDKGSVDKSNIFIVGASGGGYATLGSYLKTRHKIKAFLSWVPISDLSAWYYQSKHRNSEFANDILKCTTNENKFDIKAARQRSPLFWDMPLLPNGKLEIYAGINDGYEGSVPISHSILFFNKLVNHYGRTNKIVNVSDIIKLLTRGIDKETSRNHIDGHSILLSSNTPEVSLTVFDGGHQVLNKFCFERLKRIAQDGF